MEGCCASCQPTLCTERERKKKHTVYSRYVLTEAGGETAQKPGGKKGGGIARQCTGCLWRRRSKIPKTATQILDEIERRETWVMVDYLWAKVQFCVQMLLSNVRAWLWRLLKTFLQNAIIVCRRYDASTLSIWQHRQVEETRTKEKKKKVVKCCQM